MFRNFGFISIFAVKKLQFHLCAMVKINIFTLCHLLNFNLNIKLKYVVYSEPLHKNEPMKPISPTDVTYYSPIDIINS